jgi:hypothetical protein
MRPVAILLAALCVAAPLATPAAAQPAPEAACHVTPDPLPAVALDATFADPFVYCAEGRFVVVASNWAGVHVPVATSPDLSAWVVEAGDDGAPLDALPELPAWVLNARGARPDVWAPEVAHLGERWVLYFSARHATARTPAGRPRECIGAAVSDRPDRDFRPLPRPLVCGSFGEGVIDPSFLRDGAGGTLYFKSDGNCCRLPTTLYAAPLAADGLALAGAIRPVGVSNDRDWEGEIVEAPTMVRHGGRFVLFYSGGLFFTPGYGVAYALCEGPLGPCRKPEDNRVITGRPDLLGPGHQSVFEADGRSFIAFHALSPTGRDGPDHERVLHIEALVWDGDAPRVATPPLPPPPGP